MVSRGVKTTQTTVINYKDQSIQYITKAHLGAQDDPTEGIKEEETPAMMNSKIRFDSPQNSTFVLNYDEKSINNKAFHEASLPVVTAMQQGAVSSGQELLSNNGDPWTVTFWTGAEDGVDVTTSTWHGIRAKPDSGANGN